MNSGAHRYVLLTLGLAGALAEGLTPDPPEASPETTPSEIAVNRFAL
jgi:hypothetical protein